MVDAEHRKEWALATGGTLQAIVLAAGFGSRFGGEKLTAPWHGRMLIEGALAAAIATPAWSVTVVWGADEAVPAAARAYFEGRGEAMRLKLVHAEHHARGLASSLKAGIESLPADCAGAYIFLGDMPRVPTDVLEPLAEALAGGALAAAPLFEGRRGHPVLFSRALFGDLLKLEGDKGAGGLLASLVPDQLALVPAPDDGVLYDVDLRTDLA
jgi:molybdenum cofactor cytidylyltransferase